MKLKLATLLLTLLVWTAGHAYQLETHYGTVPGSYNYWFGSPDDMTLAKPLVIFLHGKSLCGNNLNQVKRYGTIDAIERGRELDAFVIAPQNPGGSWSPEKIMKIVEWSQHHYNIDPTRIYVLGMSLGGHGTLDFAAAYPDKVAAAMALCGGNAYKDVKNLNQVPLWIVHGTADTAVSISGSDRLVKTMEADDPSTPRLHYDRVKGMDHSKPARFFYLAQTYDWLFSHRLTDKDRGINETFAVTDALMNNAYADLSYGKGSQVNYASIRQTVPKSSKSSSQKRYSHSKKRTGTIARLGSQRTSVKKSKSSKAQNSHKKRKVRVAL